MSHQQTAWMHSFCQDSKLGPASENKCTCGRSFGMKKGFNHQSLKGRLNWMRQCTTINPQAYVGLHQVGCRMQSYMSSPRFSLGTSYPCLKSSFNCQEQKSLGRAKIRDKMLRQGIKKLKTDRTMKAFTNYICKECHKN